MLILNIILGAYQDWKSCRNVRRDRGLECRAFVQHRFRLRAGALFAIGMLATPCAVAQTVDPPDSLFLRPATEGDPLQSAEPTRPA